MVFEEKDRPLNESRGLDDDKSQIVRTDEVKQIRKDFVSDQEVFIGRAVAQDTLISQPLWQIQRLTIIADNTQVKEFAAKAAYNQIWNDRGSIFPGFTPGTGVVNLDKTSMYGVIDEVPQFADALAEGTQQELRLNRLGGIFATPQDFQTMSPALILPSGTLNTAEIIRLVGGNFGSTGALLTHDWTETFVGTGTTTIADGELALNTGTTANSEASVRSFRRAPFSAATFNLSHLAFSLTSIFNADVTRRFGAYNPDAASVNGVYFEFTGGNGTDDIDVNLVMVKNDVTTSVAEGSFNGGNTFIKDSNIHIYENIYNAGTVFWFQDRKLIHQSSSLTSAAFGTPDLQVGMEVINTGGNIVDNELVTRGAAISRLGANNSIPRFFHIVAAGTFVIKNTSGKLVAMNINDKGGGASAVDIFNNTSAAGTDFIANVDIGDVQGPIVYNTTFDIGLTIVVSGVNIDLTIIYE